MTQAETLIKLIKKWAQDRDDIRLVVLFGSFAHKGKTDELSDVDLVLFTHHPDRYLEDENWWSAFAPVWLTLTQKEEGACQQTVIYDGGVMVEFNFLPLSSLEGFQSSLPPQLEPGYKILVDKDKQGRHLPKPGGQSIPPAKPSPEELHRTITAFWKDAYLSAKYLLRDDLWRAKHYDWAMKQHLLQMLSWHTHIVRHLDNFTSYQGKHIKEWLEPNTYLSLMSSFGRFYPADSWRALEETIKGFTILADEVAKALRTDSRKELAEILTAWIDTQKKQAV